MNELKYIITDKCPSDLPQIDEIRDWELFLKDCHVDCSIQYIVANDELKAYLTKKSSDLSLKDCPEIDIACPQIDTTIRIQRIENEKLKKIVLSDDEGNGSMPNNYYVVDTDYGPIGRGNVLPVDMPDKVSERIGMERVIETGIPLDLEAMKEVVAQTCTAAFHRRKGYVDSTEQSAVTFRELLKLFDIHLRRNVRKMSDIIIELENCFIYICSGDCNEKVAINPVDFEVHTDDRFIIYILNQNVVDKLQQEKEYRQRSEEIFERLTTKNQKKPILVFRWIDSVERGNNTFFATDILRALDENGFEWILQFDGVYKYGRTNKSGLILLTRKRGEIGVRYNVVHLKTAQDFIDYWDYNIKMWANRIVNSNGLTSNEFFWPEKKIGLIPELIPEPYYGDPNNCSIVILNFNPHADVNPDNSKNGTDTCHIKHVKNINTVCGQLVTYGYSKVAKDFPILGEKDEINPFHSYDGRPWWVKKKEWLNRLFNAKYKEIDAKGKKSSKRPFALELCAWHSSNWRGVSYKDVILENIAARLEGVLTQSILNSDLKIGVCVGAAFGDKILRRMGFEEIKVPQSVVCKGNVVAESEIQSTKTYYRNNSKSRGYRVFRHKSGAIIINTWAPGSNGSPNKDNFCEFERELIKYLYN